jgi:hypothetical protein
VYVLPEMPGAEGGVVSVNLDGCRSAAYFTLHGRLERKKPIREKIKKTYAQKDAQPTLSCIVLSSIFFLQLLLDTDESMHYLLIVNFLTFFFLTTERFLDILSLRMDEESVCEYIVKYLTKNSR